MICVRLMSLAPDHLLVTFLLLAGLASSRLTFVLPFVPREQKTFVDNCIMLFFHCSDSEYKRGHRVIALYLCCM